MGHVIFLLLHIAAALFLPVALFVTIPAHLIYGALLHRARPAAAPDRPRPFSKDWFNSRI